MTTLRKVELTAAESNGPAPQHAPLDSVSSTLRISDMVTPRKIPPGAGWRKLCYAASFRSVNPGESRSERHLRELRDRIRRHIRKGAIFCAKAAIRPMMRARSGRIVNLSSVVAELGNTGQAVYAASKAALIGLTKSLAREYASRSVTVNCQSSFPSR